MKVLSIIKKVIINIIILYFFITIPVFFISGFIYNEYFKENIHYRNQKMMDMALELEPLFDNKYSIIKINRGRALMSRFLFAQTTSDYNKDSLLNALTKRGYILKSINKDDINFSKNNFSISIIYNIDNRTINVYVEYDDYININNI